MRINLDPHFLANAIVVLVGVLVAFLIIFIGIQFWYYYAETERTLKTVEEISRPIDERIQQITGSSSVIASGRVDEAIRLSFLKEFKSQQVWEWSHERVNRRYSTFISLAEWFAKSFVLFLAVLNERVTHPDQVENRGLKRSTAFLLVFFAALAIAFPAVSQKLGYEARQRLHDFRAQQLGFLIVELESGATEPRTAWLRYQAL